MTFYTQWNNVKPLALLVTALVVILLCGHFLALNTLETGCLREFSANNSIIDSIFCFSFCFIIVAVFSMTLFPDRTFCKFLIVSFTFFTVAKYGFPLSFQVSVMFAIEMVFVIFLMALSAICLEAKGPRRIFIKCREHFFGLALAASFRYSWFRHGFFLIKKLCLGPIAAQTVVGSFYNTTFPQKFNQKVKNYSVMICLT